MGDTKKRITINQGATLKIKTTSVSNQRINVGEGNAVVSVPSGVTFTQSGSLRGAGNTLIKKGSGAFNLNSTTMDISKLQIVEGAVNAILNSNSVVQLPGTVEFQGGTLNDPNNQNAYATNSANFIVP